MNPRRCLLPILALLCVAALLAGCGSSGSSSSGTTATTSSTAAGSSTSTSGSNTSSTSSAAAGSPEVKAAVAECKQIIQAESKLPASAKTKLEGACAQAAKGNTNAVKVAAREVCEEVINKASVPGSAKEEALKTCRK